MKVFNPDKELYKIQHDKKNRVILFIILLLVVSVVSYSFALYQVRYSKRIIYTKVAPFSNHDLEFAVYIGDIKVDDFPESAGYQYIFDHIECEKKDITTAMWDAGQYGLSVLTKGSNKCNVYFTEKYDVDYTYIGEKIAKYIVPSTGNYKLEVWGAQGGNNYWDGRSLTGGLGGYSYGTAHLESGTKLYIVVGGLGGTDIISPVGGYNGGGTSQRGTWSNYATGAGGGGATHIALVDGTLPNLESSKDSILIVAGGGGGASSDRNGGSGNDNQDVSTQFGLGVEGPTNQFSGGAGGGGYFGGNAGASCAKGYVVGSGGGGSGYLSPSLMNVELQVGINPGNGKAKITYLG